MFTRTLLVFVAMLLFAPTVGARVVTEVLETPGVV